MATTVEFTERPDVALGAAREFLISRPILHNLVLFLLGERINHAEGGRYWIACRDGEPVGVAFQSPLHMHATMTPMPEEAVDAIVVAAADAGVQLPGVSGEAGTAARFAGQWTERMKAAAVPSAGQRIYELVRLAPQDSCSGRLIQAGPDHRDLVLRWIREFAAETGEPANAEAIAGRRLAAGQVWLWADGEAKSVAAHGVPSAGVARIGPVYTPPEHRNHGYAGACVAALSAQLLAAGNRCMLYTDLGNPVSNSVYRRLGYRAVAECVRYRFQYPSP